MHHQSSAYGLKNCLHSSSQSWGAPFGEEEVRNHGLAAEGSPCLSAAVLQRLEVGEGGSPCHPWLVAEGSP